MKKTSIWLDVKDDNQVNVLKEDMTTDILIIGGGITGLTTLYMLKDTNFKVTLVEQDLIGHGITGKSTAKINYLQELIYYDISKKYSMKRAKKYLDMQKNAIKTLLDIIKKEKIDCNLQRVTSYVLTNDEKEINNIKFQKKILIKLGVKVKEHYNDIGLLKSKYAISVNDTYVFHPLKYLYHLKKSCLEKGKDIYEKTKILELKKSDNKYIACTTDHVIRAQKVILANHYPFFLFPFLTPLKVNIEKSYIAASLAKYQSKTAITSKKPTKSIRYYKDGDEYLIYLSNSSSICNNLNEKDNFKTLIKEIGDLGLKPSYIWKNDDLITIDKIPYIGPIEKYNKNLLIGTGYNTWGMTNATAAALILKDIILNNKNEYAKICHPLRINKLKNIDGFMINMASSMKGYLQNTLFKDKSWYSDKIKFKTLNGNDVAIYFDGKEHIVYNRCPHMGCKLIFNEVEKTWDCPCHASRFNIDGVCIKGPSVYNICYDENKES